MSTKVKSIKAIEINGKVWTKEVIKDTLIKSPKAVETGILKIYECQTQEEKIYQATVEDNGIGFSGCDAEILSSFAKRILGGNSLTEKQLVIAQKKMPKYAGQLFKLLLIKLNK